MATTIIAYIELMISTILTGVLVASLLGKFWSRATWQGGLACLIGGSATALAVHNVSAWNDFWGNPVIPSMLAAMAAGVVVSLLTPRRRISHEDALRLLAEERAELDVGTQVRNESPDGGSATDEEHSASDDQVN